MVHRGHIEQVFCSHNVQPKVYLRILPRCDYLAGRISLNPYRRWQVMGGVKNSFPPSLDVSSIQIYREVAYSTSYGRTTLGEVLCPLDCCRTDLWRF